MTDNNKQPKIITNVIIEKRLQYRKAMESPIFFKDAEVKVVHGFFLEITQYLACGHRTITYPLDVLEYWNVEIEVKAGAE